MVGTKRNVVIDRHETENKMTINFDEEILKFRPSIEVDKIEEEILNTDLSDVTDVIENIIRPKREPVEEKHITNN